MAGIRVSQQALASGLCIPFNANLFAYKFDKQQDSHFRLGAVRGFSLLRRLALFNRSLGQFIRNRATLGNETLGKPLPLQGLHGIKAGGQRMRHSSIKSAFLAAIVAACLLELMLHRQSNLVREYEAAGLSLGWMLLACLAFWLGTFLFLTFNRHDLPLIAVLCIGGVGYFMVASTAKEAFTLFFGATLGRGASFLLQSERRKAGESEFRSQELETRIFLVSLTGLLAFAAWWHLDMSNNSYSGPRWMGLWNNPNI